MNKPLFSLGAIVSTPGALEALNEAGPDTYMELLRRHITGDWGEVCEEDAKENDFSVENGFRILSAYTLSTGVKVWIITERDRSATTFLLPEEY
jgi:hypothetical protein